MSTAPLLVTLTVQQLEELVERAASRALEKHQVPPESDWMSQEEACRHLGITSKTLRKHIPPSGMAGHKLRWRRSALDSWVESRRLRAVK